jgi:predicted Zn-dependent protease
MKAKTVKLPAKTVRLTAKTVKRLAILIAILSLVGGTSVFIQRFQLQRLGRIQTANAEQLQGLAQIEIANAKQLQRLGQIEIAKGYDLRLMSSVKAVRDIPTGGKDLIIVAAVDNMLRGCDLRLMSSVKDVSDIPTEGKDLIIVAAVDNMLHFRVFDGDGKSVVNTDEKRLTEQARQIDDLKKQLVVLWPPHELTGSEKGLVINAVTSIVGHTHILHFRVFDGDGNWVEDTDEKRLTQRARQIDDLKKQLVVLWPPHELTESEKGLAVTSIVDTLAKAKLAEAEGHFVDAETLFRQYLQIFPDDVEVKIKRADAILKVSRSPDRQSAAVQIYNEILKQDDERNDVRRLLAKLKIDMKQFMSAQGKENGADTDLKRLLEFSPKDGELHFLMGQCYEGGGDDAEAHKNAVNEYQQAIEHFEHNAPQRIDASEQLAMLLCNKELAQNELDTGCNLKLMSSVKDVSDIPIEGKDLIIVAAVDNMLHFRIFAGDGKRVVDTDEKRLTKQARQIDDLKKQLVVLWPPHELTGSEKRLVISAVNSIEANQVIESLVAADPDNYRVYLVRGRYNLALAARDQSSKSLLSAAKEDFEKARKKAPKAPEVYLALAWVVENESKSNADEVRRILVDGQKNAPEVAKISDALASVELRAGKVDKAIEVLESGLKSASDPTQLRVILTYLAVNSIEADQVIESLVAADPDNYRVYLARGRYNLALAARDQSSKSLLSAAKEDFEKARKKAPKAPEVYLALALVVANESKSNAEEVRRILEDGKKNAPEVAKIYEALASVELRAGKVDKAIEVLESGLKSASDPTRLRELLTYLLAEHGDTDKLLGQIKDLRRFGYPQRFIQFITAWYWINASEFLKARQLLLALPGVAQSPDQFKATVNELLARCYGHLGEPEMQQDALLRAVSGDPQNVKARLGWIENMVNQGNTEGAIKEYRLLVDRVPGVRLVLARLLFAQNQRRPEPQRNWNEVTELIKQAAEASPESIEPVLLRTDLLVAQGNPAAAHDTLEKTRAQFPKSLEIRIAQASLMAFQGRVSEAMDVIDQAKKQLGDSVELRLARARLWASQKEKGPQVVNDLVDLGEDVKKFSKPDRKKLLNGLAIELMRQQNLDKAYHLWTRLAAEDPSNLELRLTLLDLAFQMENKDDIEKNIKQIKEIEGNEGLQGLYCQVQYLLWQARRTDDKTVGEAERLQARRILSELMRRRGDSAVIPLALANLEEQELKEALKQGSMKEEEIKAKEETIIGLYQRAINLGRRDSAIVRHTVDLLFKNGRSSDALALIATIPVEAQLAGNLPDQARKSAYDNHDFQLAERLAYEAIAAKPDNFQERLWLVQILLASDRQDAARIELLKAVDLSPNDPDRWVALTYFMIFTKQPQEAEKVIRQAEKKLPPSLRPMALAQCCEAMGRAYDNGATEAAGNKWYDEATKWYEQAQTAHDEDISIKRRFTEFLLRSNQISKAQGYLDAILRQGFGAKTAATFAWARRARAVLYAHARQLSKALALFEEDRKPAAAGHEGKALNDPEDLRVLARILDLERTSVHRKRAIEILETLADKNLAISDDRLLLAHLYDATDDWPKARLTYRELDLRTRNPKDMETLSRRPFYLAQYVRGLLQHRQPDDQKDLGEAQQLVDDIKRLQPDAVGTLVLQVEIDRARKQIAQAVKLIREFAARPNPTPQVLKTLADLAEKIQQFELAEELYGRLAAPNAAVEGKRLLAAFLGRRGNTKKALDMCELLWTNDREVVLVGSTCIEILFGSDNNTRTPEQKDVDRVVRWFDQAIAKAQNERHPNPLLDVGLGNLHELRGDYQKATELYLRAIKEDSRNGFALNNLAWLATLKYGNFKQALTYADLAVDLNAEQPDFLDTRGVVRLKAGNPQLALDDLLKAVEIDPSSPAKLFHLAQALLRNNDKEKAKRTFAMAKTKGLTSNSLHALERQNYQALADTLGSP